MREANKVKCHFCERVIDITAEGTYQAVGGEIAGWLPNRAGGGANVIRLPKRVSFWSCRMCIDERAAGHEGQEKLL